MSITLSALQQQRRDTAANWTSANPTLLAGEIGVETDTGLLKIGNGSTAWTSLDYLPLSFEGYAANGIYNPTANQVALATNGTGRLFIDSSGRVVIGATSSPVQFSVQNASASQGLEFDTASGFASGPTLRGYYRPGSAYKNLGITGAQVVFGINDVEKVRIDSSGRVGIGTSSPSQLLTVDGTALFGTGFDTASSTGLGVQITKGGSYAAVTTQASSAASDATLAYRAYKGTSKNFEVTCGGGAYFASSVGIGTASPAHPLQVETTGTGTSAGSNSCALFQSQASGRDAHIRFGDSINATARIGYLSNNLYAYVNGAERMRIDSSGRVGIGTSSPSTRFHVNSSDASATYLRVENTGGYALFGVDGSGNAYAGAETNDAFGLVTNGSYRIYITAGGNVGIGTSSPDYSLTIGDGSSYVIQNLKAATNEFCEFRFGDTDSVAQGKLTYDNATDSLRISVNATERMRIDSSGRLLVGTSSAVTSTNAQHSKLQVIGNTNGATGGYLVLGRAAAAASAGQTLGEIYFTDNTAGQYASIRCDADAATGSGDHPGRLVFSTTADGASSPTERMRINSLGFFMASNDGSHGFPTSALHQFRSNENVYRTLYVENTNNTSGSGTYNSILGSNCNNTSSYHFVGNTGTADKVYIYGNGNIVNTNNSYGSLSDIKLKENIVDANSQWSDIKALQVRNYNFKEGQTHTQIGVIAQEVELVSPGLVSESPDFDEDGNDLGTVTKSVNYSVLYMKAVKALQEAMERIEQLEQRLTDAGL